MTWYVAAGLSAFFAAVTAIFAKVGIRDVDSNLATAIRTTIILVFTWGIVVLQGNFSTIYQISKHAWVFLVLSALATGLSWLFYFYAIKVGEVSRVVSIDKLSLVLTVLLAGIILKEKMSVQAVVGAFLMIVGAMVIVWA